MGGRQAVLSFQCMACRQEFWFGRSKVDRVVPGTARSLTIQNFLSALAFLVRGNSQTRVKTFQALCAAGTGVNEKSVYGYITSLGLKEKIVALCYEDVRNSREAAVQQFMEKEKKSAAENELALNEVLATNSLAITFDGALWHGINASVG